MAETAARTAAIMNTRTTRRSAVIAQPTAAQTLSANAAAALTQAKDTLHNAPRTALRFFQFLRAYMRAFAAGFGVFLLASELASGHFNVFTALLSHLFAIVAAPFYALMLAPAIYGFYGLTGMLPVRDEHRAYILGTALGAVMLVNIAMKGDLASQSAIRGVLFALAVTAAGVVAAYTFNRSVSRLRGTRQTVPPRT
ncbi:MAG: hypothetical protein JNL45_00620 [Hyphomicrobium sp.]|nr:hypothetical protein [Hyphomicrobium sp.]